LIPNHNDMNGAMYFKDAYGIPTKRYGKATLRIGKVVLNSHVRVTSISNTSPENIHITNIRKKIAIEDCKKVK